MVSIESSKFESTDIIKFTRDVGKAKMHKFDQNSEVVKYLKQFVLGPATRRNHASMKQSEAQASVKKKTETARLTNR